MIYTLEQRAIDAADDAFARFSEALGGDNLVTSKYDVALCGFALVDFKNETDNWTEEDVDIAADIIDKRIWELTTVEDD